MRIIDATTATILNSFQTAYYNQIGRKMVIGSEEHTLSSLFAYVMAAYTAMVNAAYDNRFLNTANGAFLDNIAAQYGLDRTPTTFCNPYFEGAFTFRSPDSRVYEAGAYSLEIAGHTYANTQQFTQDSSAKVLRFGCTEPHSEALSKDDLTNALVATMKFSAINFLKDGLMAVETPLANDAAFREYIRQNKRLYAVGIAEAFEAATMLSSPHFVDAHVVRQNETGYEAGKVKVIVKPHSDFNSTLGASIITDLDIPAAKAAIESLNITPVGTTSVNLSKGTGVNLTDNLGTIYVTSLLSTTEASRLIAAKLAALKPYINNTLKIGAYYYPQTTNELLKKPLTEISTNPDDFGLTPAEYEAIKDFTILGAGGTSTTATDPRASGADWVTLSNFSYSYRRI